MKRFFFAFVILFLCSQIFAGMVIEEVTTDSQGNKDTDITYIQKNKSKTVSASKVMIFDIGKGTICFLSPEQKIYWSGTIEEWQKSMKEARKQAEEFQLKQMTSEQRKAYESYKKTMENKVKESTSTKKKVQVEIKKTSKKATIAGYSSQKYQVWVNGKLKKELWVCPKINIKDEVEPDKLNKFIKAMSSMNEDAGNSYEATPEYMKLTILMEYGYLLKTVKYDESGNKNYTTETVKVEKKNIPNSEFNAPKNYKKLTTAEFFKAMMGGEK